MLFDYHIKLSNLFLVAKGFGDPLYFVDDTWTYSQNSFAVCQKQTFWNFQVLCPKPSSKPHRCRNHSTMHDRRNCQWRHNSPLDTPLSD